MASPYFCAVGLALLAAFSFAEGMRLLENATVAWTVSSARAVGGALVAMSGLAMFAGRLWPVLGRRRSADEGAVNADLIVVSEEGDETYDAVSWAFDLSGRRRAAFSGHVVAVGVGVLFLALLGYALAPVWQPAGLARGGVLELSTSQHAEAAEVFREGLKVKENLGGWRFELTSLDLGRLEAGGSEKPAEAQILATHIPTGEQVKGSVTRSQPILVGDFTLRLGAVAPTPRPVGVLANILDTQTGASLELPLIINRPVGLPDTETSVTLTRVEPDFMDGQGLAAQGVIQEGRKGPAREFWLFEKSRDYDGQHRGGRYKVSFGAVIPGHRVLLNISQPVGFDPISIFIALLALGTFLFFFTTQTSAMKVVRRGKDAVILSSLNDAEGLIIAASTAPERYPGVTQEEDEGEVEDDETDDDGDEGEA